MEIKEISPETLEKIKTLPRIDYTAYVELINQKQVIRLAKLKTPRTIFFDEESGFFLYMNPYHRDLCKCGTFNEESLTQ